MDRKVMATALRGTKVKSNVKTPGICALLGRLVCDPSRRTICAGRRRPWLAISSKKQEQIVLSVTGKVYSHSKCRTEKRAVLDGIAAELRRIISEPAETELRLVVGEG